MGTHRRVSSLSWSLVIGVGIGATNAGCLVTSTPTFTAPNGTEAGGECMCAECWTAPFCASSDRTQFKPLGSHSTDNQCGQHELSAFPLASKPATRVLTLQMKSPEGAFFCLPPPGGKNVDAPLECPANSAQFQNVACQDIPEDCRVAGHNGCTQGDSPPPGSAMCSEQNKIGPTQTTCTSTPDGGGTIADADDAIADLIEQCAAPHPTLPTGAAPARFCYLACLDPNVCGEFNSLVGPPGLSCQTCDMGSFDPPTQSPTSIPFLVDPSTSSVELVVVPSPGTSYNASIDVTGRISFDVDRACVGDSLTPGTTCSSASIGTLMFEHSGMFDLAGSTLGLITVQNATPLPGVAFPSDDHTLVMSINAGADIFATGYISGLGVVGNSMITTSPQEMTIDWAARTFTLSAAFQSDDDTSQAIVTLNGTIPDLPPLANAGPNQTVQCTSPAGADVQLSAAASTDPDGAADLGSFAWSWVVSGTSYSADGEATTAALPLGTTEVGLQVSDNEGLLDSSSLQVSVVDTTPPEISNVALATDCLWPPNHKMHLFRVGEEVNATVTDTCDPTAGLEIVSVTSNEPESGSTTGEIVFGSGAFCLRAERDGGDKEGRQYTVTLGSRDAAGNLATTTAIVSVPHDQGGKDKCRTGDLAPTVADDDPRCELDLSPAPVVRLLDLEEHNGAGGAAGASLKAPLASCAVGGAREELPWLTLAALGMLGLRRRGRP